MSSHFLYSTNPFLKQHIQAKYRGDVHYVWCSEHFDSSRLSSYSLGAMLPPSSNPADIYRELSRDVGRKDRHSAKITAQRAVLIQLANEWYTKAEITEEDRDDIIFQVNTASIEFWRPLVYVIPLHVVASRRERVRAQNRAGLDDEYIVKDLQRNEFDMIEFIP